jgi:hypothetical protein
MLTGRYSIQHAGPGNSIHSTVNLSRSLTDGFNPLVGSRRDRRLQPPDPTAPGSDRTHTYVLTPDGTRVAALYTKSYPRVIDPLFVAAKLERRRATDPDLSSAFRILDRSVDRYVRDANLAA